MLNLAYDINANPPIFRLVYTVGARSSGRLHEVLRVSHPLMGVLHALEHVVVLERVQQVRGHVGGELVRHDRRVRLDMLFDKRT